MEFFKTWIYEVTIFLCKLQSPHSYQKKPNNNFSQNAALPSYNPSLQAPQHILSSKVKLKINKSVWHLPFRSLRQKQYLKEKKEKKNIIALYQFSRSRFLKGINKEVRDDRETQIHFYESSTCKAAEKKKRRGLYTTLVQTNGTPTWVYPLRARRLHDGQEARLQVSKLLRSINCWFS